MTGTQRALCLAGAILLGIALPAAHHVAFLLGPLQIVMLFFVFLQADFRWAHLDFTHARLAGANCLLPLLLGAGFGLLGPQARLAAVLAAMAPTATNAPVLSRYLRANTEHVTISMVGTNLLSIATIPVLLQVAGGVHATVSAAAVGKQLFTLVLPALLAGQGLRRFVPRVTAQVLRFRGVNFWLWNVAIILAVGKATHFILSSDRKSMHAILLVLGVSACVCLLNFAIGAWLGGKKRRKEACQALGQKNTLLVTWVALTHLDPMVALAPIGYIVFHNLVNSWQLHRAHLASLQSPDA